jgi:uncharacterized protein (DUF779 family)
MIEARAVVGGRGRDVLARVTQLCVHGGECCEGKTPVQWSSDDVNVEEALVLSEAVDSVLVARARSVPWAN